jgi:hypothetical protein
MCYLTQPPVLFQLWVYCGGFAVQTPKWTLGCRIACFGLSLGCIVVYVFEHLIKSLSALKRSELDVLITSLLINPFANAGLPGGP